MCCHCDCFNSVIIFRKKTLFKKSQCQTLLIKFAQKGQDYHITAKLQILGA